MAAAFIPLIAPIAIPVINDLVAKLVEKLFPPKSGQQKLPAATEISAAIQAGLHAVGALAGVPQAGAELATGVQASVDKLNAQGALKGAATLIDALPAGIGGPKASVLVRALAGFLEAAQS